MPTIIRSGGGGVDISDATATKDEVLQGYKFYGAGSDELQEGAMADHSDKITIDVGETGSAGYYSSISVNPNSLGTATEDDVLSTVTFTNNSKVTKQGKIAVKGAATINVGETGGAGYYSSISVNKTPLGTAKAEHVLSTVTFTNSAGTTQNGTMTNRGAFTCALAYGESTTANGAGYYSSISVSAPGRYGNATKEHVLNNVSFMNTGGNQSTGNIPTYGDTTKTIDPGGNWSGAGYYKSIKVTANKATYYGNATNSVVLAGYTFMNSSGTNCEGTYKPVANYLSITTADVTSSWTKVTFNFTPVNYVVGWHQGDWNHNSSNTQAGQGTHYGLKHYQSGANIHFCKEGSNNKSFTARIIAYA